MLRRSLLAAIAAALAAPAHAAGGGGDKAKPSVAQYVDISPVALPVIAGRRLVNYVFVNVRLNLVKTADATRLRGMEPRFRDALVRAAHRTPFTGTRDYLSLDETKLAQAMMREAAAIAGAGQVVSVKVTSQTPKHRSGVPRPPAA